MDGTLPSAGGNAAAVDYERQLKFRNPPDDTVVTWCAWHEVRDATRASGTRLWSCSLVARRFVDGAKMEQCKWRTKQE